MKQILVTGAKGQLGLEIQQVSGEYPEYGFLFTDIDELDITDLASLEAFLTRNKIDVILNCAAYNLVDGAEKEAEKAFLVNSTAVGYMAQLAQEMKIFLIHISTDYVFDGMNNVPYNELDQPNPLSTYAKSKHEGETQVMNNLDKGIIIRTSWLYSTFGHNFVKTILTHARQKKQLKVVYDQVGTPTYGADLANTLMRLIPRCDEINEVEILHYSNEGVASWYDFAKAITDISGIDTEVLPVQTKEYPLPAHRPFYSVLNKDKIKRFLKTEIPHWRDSLQVCLNELNQH